MDKKKKYFKLIKELICMAEQRENETMDEDNFTDLNDDLFEEMKRMASDISAELRAQKIKSL